MWLSVSLILSVRPLHFEFFYGHLLAHPGAPYFLDLQDLKPRQIPDKVEDISALYAQNRCLLCPKRPIEDQPSSPKTAHGSDDDAYESPKISTISKQYFVKGVVSGHSIEALPDSGANVSIISNTLASELGLDPKPGTEKTIYLANKKAIRSPGMVTVPWKFDGESRMYPLDCWILPKSIHTIVLGKPFLNVTQTLKALASRIKCKIVNGPRRLRLHLLGGESENEKVWGYLNDRFTTAFPDTGSDVMLISRKYAEELELDMDTRVEDRVEVEFPDGSTAWTSGIIRDASWRIGSKTTNCDFYVLDELCVDVVLSNEYLFNENVFSECDIYFFDAELDVAGDFSSSFCNIRLIGRYGGYLNSLEEEYLEDCKLGARESVQAVTDLAKATSPDAFTDEKVQRELARRDRIRDEINELPEDQRDTARLDEVERQRQWEQKRQIHRNTYHPQSTSQQTPSTPHRTEVVQGRIHPETAGKFHLSTWKKRVKKKIGS